MSNNIEKLQESCWDTMLNDPEAALAMAKESLDLVQVAQANSLVPYTYRLIGLCYLYIGTFQEALTYLDHAIDAALEQGDIELVARSYNNLGGTHFGMGQFAIAAQYYETALSMTQYFNDPSAAFAIRCNLSELYGTLSDHNRADVIISMLDQQDLSIIPLDACCNYYLLKVRQALLLGDIVLFNRYCALVRGSAEPRGFQQILFQLEILEAEQVHFSGKVEAAMKALQTLIDGPHFTSQGIDRYRVIYLLAKWHFDIDDGVAIDRYLFVAVSLESVVWPHEILQNLAVLTSMQQERWGDYKSALFHANEARTWAGMLRQCERDALMTTRAKAARVADQEVRKVTQAMQHRALEMLHEQTLHINKIGCSLASTLDFSVMGIRLFEALSPVMPVTTISLVDMVPYSPTLEIVLVVENGKVIPDGLGIFSAKNTYANKVVSSRKIEICNDFKPESFKLITGTRVIPKSALFLPLMVGDRVLGVWSVQSEVAQAYGDGHIDLVEAVAPFVAIAFNNAQTHERNLSLINELNSEKMAVVKAHDLAAHQAQHDALTGLPNRIALKHFFAEQMHRVKSSDRCFHVIFMDMNGFKRINDNHGHRFGDDVIVAIADRLKGFFRQTDIICRLGGDEFVAIIPQFNGDKQIDTFVGRIKTSIGEPFLIQDKSFELGVSIGLSTYPTHGKNLEDLLACADRKMYQDKSNKRTPE